jgi:hypothetical protein
MQADRATCGGLLKACVGNYVITPLLLAALYTFAFTQERWDALLAAWQPWDVTYLFAVISSLIHSVLYFGTLEGQCRAPTDCRRVCAVSSIVECVVDARWRVVLQA